MSRVYASSYPTRSFECVIDRASLSTREDSTDLTIPIAISSEYPVMRHDWESGALFREILDHAPGSINLTRAARGLPFIPAHDTRAGDVYGKVDDIRIGTDRRLRGVVRFSRSARAQEKRQDMLDDILTEVSVGYDPGPDYTESRAADGVLERRYTNWTPLEVSVVAIPADPSVGKGRAHSAPTMSPQPATMARSVFMEPEELAPTAPVIPAAASATPTVSSRSRTETILGFAVAAGLTAQQTDTLIASGRDVDGIGRELLARMNADAQHSGAPQPAVQLTDKEQKGYSIIRALNGIVSGRREGFEFEVSDEFAKNTKRQYSNTNSLFLPLNIRTQLSVGGTNKGAELRGTELRPELIELLRQRSLVLGTLGARFLPGLTGNVAFPRQTAGATAEWVAEAPGSDMSMSSLSLDQVVLSPRTLMAATTVSRQLLAQSTPQADGIIFDDLIEQHATAIDRAAFWGSGASNQPTGVGVTTGTNLVAMGTNGAAGTLAKMLEAHREVEIDNAMNDNVRFVTTPGVKFNMAGTVRFASTDSRTLWDLDTSTVIGTQAFSSTNIPSTLTKGTASGTAHGAILGDFGHVLVGEWGSGAELIVDPYSLAKRNLIAVTSIQFADVQVRIPSAFAVFRDLLAP